MSIPPVDFHHGLLGSRLTCPDNGAAGPERFPRFGPRRGAATLGTARHTVYK